jgi:hypothetical protein
MAWCSHSCSGPLCSSSIFICLCKHNILYYILCIVFCFIPLQSLSFHIRVQLYLSVPCPHFSDWLLSDQNYICIYCLPIETVCPANINLFVTLAVQGEVYQFLISLYNFCDPQCALPHRDQIYFVFFTHCIIGINKNLCHRWNLMNNYKSLHVWW